MEALNAKQQLFLLLAAKAKRERGNKLARYTPYVKQSSFYALGRNKKERLLRAGNQQGKTYAGGAEAAYHLTGAYPDGWAGRVFDHPVIVWCGSDTGETTRDNPQRILCGPLGEWGTGFIPERTLGDKENPRGKLARGTPDLLDYIRVKHKSGGWSLLRFKPYSLGRQKWQGPSVDVVWFDEEPPADVYYEGMARLIATNGIAYTTFTPLLDMSEVVMRFLNEPNDSRADINMTVEDAEHLSAEEKQKIIDSFPEHQRAARLNGVPILGSGQIFPVDEESIKFKMQDLVIPGHWAELGAIDFGWDHPTAAVRLYWDRDNDVVYVTQTHRLSKKDPVYHAAALRPWGEKLPWAWPHDGNNDTAAGENLAKQYGEQHLNFLPERAQYEDGSTSVEAGLMDMLSRMETGRLKVADHLNDWFDEFRLYHRKDGRVVKLYDDLMSATRYGIMSLRYGATVRKVPRSRESTRSGWAM